MVKYKEQTDERKLEIKERRKLWRSKNKDSVAVSNKKYREKNKENIAAYNREYYKETTGRRAVSKKLWREKNKETTGGRAVSKKLWREKNKEKCREYDRRYREKTKAHQKARAKAYREEKPEMAKARAIAYQRKNPETRKRWQVDNAWNISWRRSTYRAWRGHKSSLEIIGLPSELAKQVWNDTRAIASNYFPNANLHHDHMHPLAGAKSPEEGRDLNHFANFAFIPASENISKHDKPFAEWFDGLTNTNLINCVTEQIAYNDSILKTISQTNPEFKL